MIDVRLGRVAGALGAVLVVAACSPGAADAPGGAEPPTASSPAATASPSPPRKVTTGVRVVLDGPDEVMASHRDVLEPTERLAQYMWDYFAYPARPPDPGARALIRDDVAFAWSRERTPDLRAPQKQGTVVLAVLSVRRSGDEATVSFCEDRSRLTTIPGGASGGPRPAPTAEREPVEVHTVRWVHTDASSVDGDAAGGRKRWLATDATLVGEDPRCAAAVAAVRVPEAD